MLPMAVHAALLGKWKLTAHKAFTPFQCSPVTCPVLSSLPPELTPRRSQPQCTMYYVVASGTLHSLEPWVLLPAGYPAGSSFVETQAPLPAGYPANYTNCVTNPVGGH